MAHGQLGSGLLTDVQAATLKVAERLLALDRTHEVAWRAVIGVHKARGDSGAAMAAYATWQSALSECETLRADLADCLGPARVARESARQVARHSSGRRSRLRVRLGVMPLRALNQSAGDELLIGLFEEMTTGLARVRWLDCVLGQPDLADLSTDLDLLLDGTVQNSEGRVRVMVRVRDVRSAGEVIWAARFDRERGDPLVLQDELAAEIIAQLDAELLVRLGERTGWHDDDEPTANDLVHQALPGLCQLQPNRFRAAGRMLEAAVLADPDNASAHAWLAYWHLLQASQAWVTDWPAAAARAAELAERAVVLDAADARSLTVAGHVQAFLGKHAEAASMLHDRALAMNPNLALAWCHAGLAEAYLGRHEEAIWRIQRASALSPRDPQAFMFDMAMTMPHFLLGHYDTAAAFGRRAIALNRHFSSSYKGYLATLGQLGREREAAAVRVQLLALEPDLTVTRAVARSPISRPDDLARYATGLQRAGLPI